MAVQQVQQQPAIIERVRIHKGSTARKRPRREAVAALREVVRNSASVNDAIAAVQAIDTAWSGRSPATREAVALMLAILELSDDAAEAAAVFARLQAHYPTARTVLEEAQRYIGDRYPGSEFRLEFGEEDVRLGMTFLYAFIPAKDYPTFKKRRDELVRWSLETFPKANGIIDIFPQSKRPDV